MEMRPFMASGAVIFGVHFTGHHILVVNHGGGGVVRVKRPFIVRLRRETARVGIKRFLSCRNRYATTATLLRANCPDELLGKMESRHLLVSRQNPRMVN